MGNGKKETYDSFTDIVDLHGNEITLKDIDYISKDLKTKMQYETEFSNNLYSNIFLYLTHKIFSEDEAKQLWVNVLNHRKNLIEALSRDPGIVVSCLDYMTNYEPILKDAKIIEKGKSDYILSSTLIDNLTNLYIRNVFDVVLDKEYNLSVRKELPMSVLMIDIDNFKNVNDIYGHSEGDQVLRQIGNIINLSIRSMDFAARYGGEEFIIIMPNTSMLFACKVGELIRKRVFDKYYGDRAVSISVGVSELDTTVRNCSELIIRADKALYYAKKQGKNQVARYCADMEIQETAVMEHDYAHPHDKTE